MRRPCVGPRYGTRSGKSIPPGGSVFAVIAGVVWSWTGCGTLYMRGSGGASRPREQSGPPILAVRAKDNSITCASRTIRSGTPQFSGLAFDLNFRPNSTSGFRSELIVEADRRGGGGQQQSSAMIEIISAHSGWRQAIGMPFPIRPPYRTGTRVERTAGAISPPCRPSASGANSGLPCAFVRILARE
jgi:hypothetical protein